MPAISYRSMPTLMRKSPQQIKVAASKTLTTIAFDSQKDILNQAQIDLKFKVNARRALGITVKKATPQKIEAQVFSKRGWLFWHVNEGTRKAKNGWRFNGNNYILVPIRPEAFTRRGKLKSGYRKRIFIIPDNDNDALVFYRPARGGENILLATLENEVKHRIQTRPERIVDRNFIRKANRLMNFHLKKAAPRTI